MASIRHYLVLGSRKFLTAFGYDELKLESVKQKAVA
jgi:hypothetical protein